MFFVQIYFKNIIYFYLFFNFVKLNSFFQSPHSLANPRARDEDLQGPVRAALALHPPPGVGPIRGHLKNVEGVLSKASKKILKMGKKCFCIPLEFFSIFLDYEDAKNLENNGI